MSSTLVRTRSVSGLEWDTHVCKICLAYFVRPWRQTNKCCSEECSTINRKLNERNRDRGRRRHSQIIPRDSDSWARQRAARACDNLLGLLQTHHDLSALVFIGTPKKGPLSEVVRRTEPETGAAPNA